LRRAPFISGTIAVTLNNEVRPRFDALERELRESAGVRIYGAGNYGRKIAALLPGHGLSCIGYIDARASADFREIGGVRVVHPDDLGKHKTEGTGCIIGVFNKDVSNNDIRELLSGFSFTDIIWHSDLPELFGKNAETTWLSSRTFILENFAKIKTIGERLCDEVSVAAFIALLRYRFTGLAKDHPLVDAANQYFPPDIPALPEPIDFVDGGAFTGDTLQDLLGRGAKLRNYWGFEPDLGNFTILASNASKLNVRGGLFPCGLSDSNCRIGFDESLGDGSHISSNPGPKGTSIEITCLKLDDALPNATINFVKLDIEGAEGEALSGMRALLATQRPRLAVCIYHRASDLWDLPALVVSLSPDYDFYLRQHAYWGFDTVFYALPRAART
jgi:FkbM family methyltransferase